MASRSKRSIDTGLRARMELRMNELGMSQRDLVEKSGLSQAVVSHISNLRIFMLDGVKIFKLADALECSARWLATGKGDK